MIADTAIPSRETEWQLRAEIVETCRRMGKSGLTQGSSGNVSARLGDRFLITPSGMAYKTMRPDDIVPLDLQGVADPRSRRPSSEWRLHRDIFAERPDISAIIHAHPTHCIAVSVLRPSIPAIHYMIALAGGADIRVAPYATFGTEELSHAAVEALRDRRACLLAHHGMVATGDDPESALALAIEVEALARQYIACLSIGEPPLLSDAELEEAIAGFADGYGQPSS